MSDPNPAVVDRWGQSVVVDRFDAIDGWPQEWMVLIRGPRGANRAMLKLGAEDVTALSDALAQALKASA